MSSQLARRRSSPGLLSVLLLLVLGRLLFPSVLLVGLCRLLFAHLLEHLCQRQVVLLCDVAPSFWWGFKLQTYAIMFNTLQAK